MYKPGFASLPVLLLLTTLLMACLAGCGPAGEDGSTADTSALTRLDFNRFAVRANLPVYWVADSNGNGAVDPDEIASLRFYPQEGNWTEDGSFTPDFHQALNTLIQLSLDSDETAEGEPADAEAVRLRLVHADLDHGIPTLVHNDLGEMSEAHRTFVSHMLEATRLIDLLYFRMNGAEALASRLPADAASRSLFRRNRGPACLAPRTQNDPACSAIPGSPAMLSDLYPAALQEDAGFCESIESMPNATGLLSPFTVVRETDGALAAVSYTEEYKVEMDAIAAQLRAAAAAFGEQEEDALRTYLAAAAQAFTDNNWEPADEAWSRMNARNSAWYLRIAPDEVYWEPCASKAGLHVTLAVINTDSLKW